MMSNKGHTVHLKVEGLVVENSVLGLAQICQSHLTQAKKIILDLSGVIAIDRRGLEWFKRTLSDNVEITRAKPWVQAMLEWKGAERVDNSFRVPSSEDK